MAVLATVDTMKLKLWQESFTTFETDQIQFYIDSTLPLIESMFGIFCPVVNRTDRIFRCDIHNREFYVKNPNPTALISVDWTAYTWVLGTDYLIIKDKFVVNDINDFIDSNFKYVDIEYTSWFAQIDVPKDIIFFHACIVEWELAKQNGKEVSSEKLWPRTVQFVDTPSNRSIIQQIAWKYMNITI